MKSTGIGRGGNGHRNNLITQGQNKKIATLNNFTPDGAKLSFLRGS